jgi:hypothetical protein
MAEFDPEVIAVFAESLYLRAARIVGFYTVGAALAGALAGGWAGTTMQSPGFGAVALGLFGGILGWASGSERAFALRFQAQTVLCQLEMERHLRVIREIQASRGPS